MKVEGIEAAAGQRSGVAMIKIPRSMPLVFYSIFAVLLLLAAWSAITLSGLIGPGYLPTPMDMGREFMNLLGDGYKGKSLWAHVQISLFRTLAGFSSV